jgi:Gram-negative bacterial TonB protein C-terminal
MTSERMVDWMDRAASRLVQHAARRTPEPLSARLEEEWLADLAERRSGFSRLRLGIGCYWATYSIAREQRVASVALARSQLAHTNVAGFTTENATLFSRRTVTFLLVASLHAAVLLGLAVGVSSKFIKKTPPEFVVDRIDKVLPRIDPLPPVKPDLNTITVDPPKPVDKLTYEPDDPPPVAGDVKEAPPETQGGTGPSLPPAVTINRVQGGPGIGFPSAHDFYPPSAIRREEQGIATVSACIDARGRLTSDPKIIQSTGSQRLDEGALTLAIAGSGHYRATTENGKPVDSCYAFRIRFDLKN